MTMTLEPGGIYVALFVRGEANTFHYSLYHHHSSCKDAKGRIVTDGMQFSVNQLGVGWITAHERTAGVMNLLFLVGLVKIGSCEDSAELERLVRVEDDMLNEIPGVTCRVYTMRAIQRLLEASILRSIFNATLEEIEEELRHFALAHEEDANMAIQPRPLHFSKLFIV